LCEATGHGWESCPTHPEAVQTRKQKYGESMARYKAYRR
jgi:hypothetical protein